MNTKEPASITIFWKGVGCYHPKYDPCQDTPSLGVDVSTIWVEEDGSLGRLKGVSEWYPARGNDDLDRLVAAIKRTFDVVGVVYD